VKESREARAERQALERWQFCDVLRLAGNRVDEEMKVPGSEYVVDVAVMTPEGRVFGVELQGVGLSHLSRKGWARDIDKAQACAVAGWVYFPVRWSQIGTSRGVVDDDPGDALETLSRCGIRVEALEEAR
jgi:hypothetical protein